MASLKRAAILRQESRISAPKVRIAHRKSDVLVISSNAKIMNRPYWLDIVYVWSLMLIPAALALIVCLGLGALFRWPHLSRWAFLGIYAAAFVVCSAGCIAIAAWAPGRKR